MRILETVLFAAISSRPFCFFIGFELPGFLQNYLILTGATAAIQFFIEGYRFLKYHTNHHFLTWQLFPAYLAFTIGFIPFGNETAAWIKFILALLQISLVGVSALLCFILPVFRTRKPTGPYQTGTISTEWIDNSRPAWDLYKHRINHSPRRLPVRIWYPISDEVAKNSPLEKYLPYARERGEFLTREVGFPSFILGHFELIKAYSHVSTDPSIPLPILYRDKKYPVVFFSHGYSSSRDINLMLIENIASYGIIVVAVEHTYDAIVTYFPSTDEIVEFDAKIPDDITEDTFWPFRNYHLHIRTADLSFAADVVCQMNKGDSSRSLLDLSCIFQNRVDTEKFMAMGHSFGGGTSINVCAKDKRFKGAFGMDAWVTIIEKEIKNGGVPHPIMLVQADKFFEDAFYGKTNMVDCESIVKHSSSGSQLVLVDGVKHQDFIDLPIYSPLLSHYLTINSKLGVELQETLATYSVEYLRKLSFI